MKGPIQSFEANYFIHATEDPTKVEVALADVLGVEARPDVQKLEGHFGNEIVSVRLHFAGEEAATAFASVVARLPKDLKAGLVANIGGLLDEHSALFLRLDKQQLVSGTLALGSVDSVRLKVKPRLFLMKGGAAGFYSSLVGRS